MVAKIICLFFIGFVVFSGCDDYSLFEILESAAEQTDSDGPLSIVPVSATVEIDTELVFSVTGGVPPYLFSVTSGSGTIDPVSGAYTAPSVPSVDIVQVEDSEGSVSDAQVLVVL